MHQDDVHRKIERAHQKLLKAQAKLHKLQGRLAHTPLVAGRTPVTHARIQWLKWMTILGLSWTGIPFLRRIIEGVFGRIIAHLDAHSTTHPVTQLQPSAANKPQSAWTFGRRSRG
jgi:hypothetical protein